MAVHGKINYVMLRTNDTVIRASLLKELTTLHSGDPKVRTIPELGIKHGAARIDIAVVNGVLHGYEIKSDRDTLLRLPEQMSIYNSVFDQMTLVVGKSHLYEAINLIPDWWGVTIAKVSDDEIIFHKIREAGKNPIQERPDMARLLWRDEALEILEEEGKAKGVRSKPRNFIYEKLVSVLGQAKLSTKVREVLFSRSDWRPDAPLVLNGG